MRSAKMVMQHRKTRTRSRRLQIGVAVVALVVGILVLTNPDEKDFEAWLGSEYGIHVSYDVNDGRRFTELTSDGEKTLQFVNGHSRKLGILSTYRYLLKDEEGKELQVKGTGILNRFVNK